MQDGEIVINQPAGHVENGETLEQAVIRETLEESGWLVTPKAILGIYAFTPYSGSDTYHRVCFICEPDQHASTELDVDILRSDWLTRQEIESKKPRSPLIMQCIDDFERGQQLPLNSVNNQHIKPN